MADKTQNDISAAAQEAMTGAKRVGEATERGARTGAAAMRRGGENAGELVRQGGEQNAQAMRHLGGVAGETMERGAHAAAAGQREFADNTANQIEHAGERLAQAVQETARDIRALWIVPGFSEEGAMDLRQGVAGIVEGVMRTNVRMAQELFRMVNPANSIELHRRLSSDYVDTMLASSAAMLRATRRSAEEALRPLEQRVEQRREAREGERGHDHGNRQHEHRQHQQQLHGRVADVMATGVKLTSPEDTVQQAAQLMRDEDTGVLPVGEGDKLVGMVTDRDVALRLVAEGRDPRQTRVRDVMSPDVRYVFEDEDLNHVAENMAEQQLRRLPVMNRDKRLVGVISLADLSRKGRGGLAARALGGIAGEGGAQAQAAE